MDVVNPMAPWRDAYEAFSQTDAAKAGAKAREEAFARFEAHGLPTRRHEYWKYTPVRGLTPHDALSAATGHDPFGEIEAYRLVFVDGFLDAARSDREALAAVVDIAGPAGAPWMDGVFGQLQTQPVEGAMQQVDRPFADLNLAMFSDGLAVRIPAGVSLEKPIHLRYEGTAAAHLRLEMLVEKGAEATVLESGAGARTTGAELVVEDGATLHHLRAQTEATDQHFTAMYARIGAEATFKSFTITQDGTLTRNESVLVLAGANGNGHIAGGILGRGSSLIDNTVYIQHESTDCESRQVFKTVVDETAKSVFQGKIYVKKDAQKTDGYQISQSVLLSERAEFNAKPELEIYADDVKCSHGSTTGALDETALFYLRSRGCTRIEAEAMLVAAFADEAITEIASEPLQDLMRTIVADWMAARAIS